MILCMRAPWFSTTVPRRWRSSAWTPASLPNATKSSKRSRRNWGYPPATSAWPRPTITTPRLSGEEGAGTSSTRRPISRFCRRASWKPRGRPTHACSPRASASEPARPTSTPIATRRSATHYGMGYAPEGPSDKTVAVMSVTTPSGDPIAVWTNYAVHGVVMFLSKTRDGQAEITGDIGGATSNYVEDRLKNSEWLSGPREPRAIRTRCSCPPTIRTRRTCMTKARPAGRFWTCRRAASARRLFA